jgi:anti-sigma regulatory factor (Ser/Thr protein kinase)
VIPLSTPQIHGAAAADAVFVRADRDGLARCLALSQTSCARWSLCDEDSQALRLAVEEACTNIVDHGYPSGLPGPLRLEFCFPEPGWAEAHIFDQATPFHPDDATEPDLAAALEDRPIGGLGWFFIKQVMTEVTYSSDAQGNALCLRRRLLSPSQPPTGEPG